MIYIYIYIIYIHTQRHLWHTHTHTRILAAWLNFTEVPRKTRRRPGDVTAPADGLSLLQLEGYSVSRPDDSVLNGCFFYRPGGSFPGNERNIYIKKWSLYKEQISWMWKIVSPLVFQSYLVWWREMGYEFCRGPNAGKASGDLYWGST